MHDSVLVSDFCLPSIYIPEAFSPNGDKQNDYLEIFGRHFKNFEIKIFNRWGEIIFISNDKDLFWDGLYRGEEMPIGTYPWILHYESTYGDAGIQTKKGSVILLR
jgi:gliding motility-associated-like protein